MCFYQKRILHQINQQYLNTHDQLTGLYNRRHFLNILEETIKEINQGEKTQARTTPYIKALNHFSTIKNTLGKDLFEGF